MMKKFKMFMIQANSPMDTLIPPGISILTARVKRSGYDFKLFDTTFYLTKEKTGAEARYITLQVKRPNSDEFTFQKSSDIFQDLKITVEEYQPNLVGLSAVETTYNMGIELLRAIETFNIPTIVGGTFATINPEIVIAEDCVDMICRGEGDGVLIELCDRMSKGEDITNIKNLWIKKDGKIYKNPMRPLVNLDEVPFQDWSIYDKRRFYKPMGGKMRVTGCIELQRGCPYNCYYCCNEKLREIYPRYCRQKSIKRFVEEIRYLKKKWGLEYIYVSAETFLTMNDEIFMEFINEFGKLEIPFWIQTRPELIKEWKIKLLESIGCESISSGIESGNLEIRKNIMNRHITDEKIISKFKILKKFKKIRICANNLMGVPTETRKNIFETIELNRKILVDNVMVHIFNPYRGTRLRQMCIDMGLLNPHSLSGDYRVDVILNQPQLSREEVMGLHRTFVMYVKFSKSMWDEIRICENFDKEGNKKFEELSELFKEKFLKND